MSDIKKNVGSAQFGTFLHKNAHFGPSNNANIMQIFGAKTIAFYEPNGRKSVKSRLIPFIFQPFIQILVILHRCRFLVEFEFRNAKGYASFEKCQARSMSKYRTHFNMSFTSLNCLKMAARQSGIPYSISNLKTLAHGQYLMNRFICVSGISADSDLIAKLNNEVFSLTTMHYDIAA